MSVNILIGDVREKLDELPADHFDIVVFSPPYWGLRDYEVEGQLGLEPSLGEHLEAMVEVCRRIRRVLKPTGTVWLNYGDCYATSPNGRSAAETKAHGEDDRTFRDKPFSTVGPIYDPSGGAKGGGERGHNKGGGQGMPAGRIVAGGYLKPKDLCMIPNRLAIALQDDGWWVRAEIVWGKPNPMPESVNDRPAGAHEKVFMLTKAERYAYDASAARQGLAASSARRLAQDVGAQEGSYRANGGAKSNGTMKAVGGASGSRNLRNYEPAPVQVWPVATMPFKGAHFATFPPELVERCLETAPKRCCHECAKPWARVLRKAFVPQADCSPATTVRLAEQHDSLSRRATSQRGVVEVTTLGFYPTCKCLQPEPLPKYPAKPKVKMEGGQPVTKRGQAAMTRWRKACGAVDDRRRVLCDELARQPTIPARVLDPFGGAGTTGLVADYMGLDCTLIELNPAYAEIARQRIRTERPCGRVTGLEERAPGAGLPLFDEAAA